MKVLSISDRESNPNSSAWRAYTSAIATAKNHYTTDIGTYGYEKITFKKTMFA